MCLLNMHPEVTRIPVGRVIEKLDEILSRNDYSSAERHLKYWLAEAESGNDLHGKLTVLNEQIGLYRKVGNETDGLNAIENALNLADEMGIENTVSIGTTYVNAATGYKAFDKTEKALELYKKAKVIYEDLLEESDSRLGGLYNNMALTYVDLCNYSEAKRLYKKAIEIMSKQKYGELEMAITYLNLADLEVAENGHELAEERVSEYLEKAMNLIDTEYLPRDGYYAFVCEKCAPVFGYYGYFLVENDLKERAGTIYERT